MQHHHDHCRGGPEPEVYPSRPFATVANAHRREPSGRGNRAIAAKAAAIIGAMILTSLAASGCGKSRTSDRAGESVDRTAGRLTVAVSILPQAFFAERIGGEQVSVQVMVGPGESVHTFDPTSRQLAGLSGARLYLAIGVPMERSFLPKVRRSFPDLPIIDTAAGIPLHEEPGNEQPGQAHEPDPHVWLSLRLARSLARSTCEALADVDPDHTPAFRGRLADLQADLAALDADIAQILKPVAGRELLVFHPAFGYFAADYGLDQVAIEAGGIEPTPKHLATLLQRARQQGQRVLFVQPEFGVSAAQKMAHQMGLEVVTLDPLARNYLGNLRDMALSIREALERK